MFDEKSPKEIAYLTLFLFFIIEAGSLAQRHAQGPGEIGMWICVFLGILFAILYFRNRT